MRSIYRLKVSQNAIVFILTCQFMSIYILFQFCFLTVMFVSVDVISRKMVYILYTLTYVLLDLLLFMPILATTTRV